MVAPSRAPRAPDGSQPGPREGGARAEGAKAAASHTGALASDDRVFDGLCRRLGILRAPTIEEAFEWGATLATQPLPKGRRVVIFTSVGAGASFGGRLLRGRPRVIPLPDDIKAAIDELVPPRWSRNNPIDLAGGETDTIPQVLDLVCGHPEVDAVIHLGLGIQAATAGMFRSGPHFPEHGLEHMAGFHEKQDRRYAEAGIGASRKHGKPVLAVTELVASNPENAAPAARKRSPLLPERAPGSPGPRRARPLRGEPRGGMGSARSPGPRPRLRGGGPAGGRSGMEIGLVRRKSRLPDPEIATRRV